MRFFIDANLPRSLKPRLCYLGFDVVDSRDVNLAMAPDCEIAEYVQSRQLSLITRDLDFGNPHRYPPSKFFGILVLAAPPHTPGAEIVSLVVEFLEDEVLAGQLMGATAVVQRGLVRFKHG